MRAAFNRSILMYALIYFIVIVLAGKLWMTALRMGRCPPPLDSIIAPCCMWNDQGTLQLERSVLLP